MSATTIALRVEEIRRRAAALPSELDQWLAWVRSPGHLDLECHQTQLVAIDLLVRASLIRQNQLLAQLPGNAALLGGWARLVGAQVAKGQRIWDYFRSKLELRFSPRFSGALWLADTIAYECHRPVLSDATLQGLLHPNELREPPLTYLDADQSPATWVRGARPDDGRDYELGNATLPIPLISLPWDSIGNVWEMVAIAHEVGHDLEADLQARALMQTALGGAVAAARAAQWKQWQGEILADLLALQLIGPAFLDALLHLLLLPELAAISIDPADPHPMPYLRILIGVAHARTLVVAPTPALTAHLDRIDSTWKQIYPNPPPGIDDWLGEIGAVLKALMDTPLAAGKPSWRQLVPYKPIHDAAIRSAVDFLRTGMNKPARMSPRHVAAAGRIAVEEEAMAAPAGLAAALGGIGDRTATLIREFATPGVRATDQTKRHRDFITSFLDRMP